ncbi:urocanate hydratase [Alicyclobacillus sp. SO9]|nr:urocanate hydratase [Alicyclobacillus sp. SO9]
MYVLSAKVLATMHCKGWQQEGIYRLLENVLAPDVAENPYELIVYGRGKAVRDFDALAAIKQSLENLEDDETLLVQSGKPVGVFRTHQDAPRVVMSTAMLVPNWANWSHFRELEQKNLTLFGQSTASSWAYIGAQGILQATFETLWEIANTHFAGTLKGKLVLSSGLGGMGSAQPLAVEMNGGVAIIVEVDRDKVMKRLETNFIHFATDSAMDALRLANEAVAQGIARTIGLVGNAVEVYEFVLSQGIVPDVVTDQTAAHDLLNGYVPAGLEAGEIRAMRVEHPNEYIKSAKNSIVSHVGAMLLFRRAGSVVFEYGNHLRGQAEPELPEAMTIPSFVTLFARDRLTAGTESLRFIALSGNPEDIYAIDDWLLKAFPDDTRLVTWIRYAEHRVHFQGLPARSVWLTYDERQLFIDALVRVVEAGGLKGPVAITRDHFAGATMASPHRETEQMLDGSDAVADWPILNALLMASTGASLVSVQQGGGVGIGYSIHAGTTVILDGSPGNGNKVRRVLLNESQLGVLRYANAGYPKAKQTAATFHPGNKQANEQADRTADRQVDRKADRQDNEQADKQVDGQAAARTPRRAADE